MILQWPGSICSLSHDLEQAAKRWNRAQPVPSRQVQGHEKQQGRVLDGRPAPTHLQEREYYDPPSTQTPSEVDRGRNSSRSEGASHPPPQILVPRLQVP